MASDIVALLRVWADNAKEQDATDAVVGLCAAADEIERLCEQLTASHESHGNEVGALTERLSLAMHERDEARREVCAWEADCADGEREYAKQRGWDCHGCKQDDLSRA